MQTPARGIRLRWRHGAAITLGCVIIAGCGGDSDKRLGAGELAGGGSESGGTSGTYAGGMAPTGGVSVAGGAAGATAASGSPNAGGTSTAGAGAGGTAGTAGMPTSGGAATGGSAEVGGSNGGGSLQTGGLSGGGAITGGQPAGGNAGGSTAPAGGATTGGVATGGSDTGGAGGIAGTGGTAATGGTPATGGTEAGGVAAGGATDGVGGAPGGSGGAGGAPPTASCDDQEQNGDETGVNCGGSCEPCPDGGGCLDGGDCVSGECIANQCTAPPVLGAGETFGEGVTLVKVAQLSFGKAAVFWDNSSNDTLWMRVATNQVLGGAMRVDGGNGRPSIAPSALVAIDPGAYLALWTEDNDGFGAYARTFTTSWSTIQTLFSAPVTYARLSTAVNHAGAGLIGLNQHYIGGTPTNDTLTLRPVSSGAIGAPQELVVQASSVSALTAVADSGDAAIAWTEPSAAGQQLWVRRRGANGVMAEKELVAEATELTLYQLAVREGGRVLVYGVAADAQLWEYEYDAAGGWSAPRLMEFDVQQFVGQSAMASARSGAVMWIWNDSASLRYRLRSPSGTWSAEQTVDSQAGYITPPVLVSYDLENFRVAYNRLDTTTSIPGGPLWTARYIRGRGFVDQEPVATEYYVDEYPDMALDTDGRGLIGWRHRSAPVSNPTITVRVRWVE